MMEVKKKYGWLLQGVLIAALASLCYLSLYGIFEKRAEALLYDPIETQETIEMLYQYNQLLYKDLNNQLNGTEMDAVSLYYEVLPDTDYKSIYRKFLRNETLTDEEMVLAEDYENTLNVITKLEQYFEILEDRFRDFQLLFDYQIEDHSGKGYLSNLSGESFLRHEEYAFLITFHYREDGTLSIGNVIGQQEDAIMKYASKYTRSPHMLPSDIVLSENAKALDPSYDFLLNKHKILNCSITYGVKHEIAEGVRNGTIKDYGVLGFTSSLSSAYRNIECDEIYRMLGLLVILCGIFLPIFGTNRKNNTISMPYAPLEIIVLLYLYLLGMTSYLIDQIYGIMSAEAGKAYSYFNLVSQEAQLLAIVWNFLILTLLFMIAWYLGICLREIRSLGWIGYFRKRCFLYQIFPYTRRKFQSFYEELLRIDLRTDWKRALIRLLLINAVILLIISSLWFVGFLAIPVYSVLIYLIAGKYLKRISNQYEVLLNATNHIAEGDLNSAPEEALGIFEPFRPGIQKIRTSFKKAVEEEVKSQRMKGELITNVSHDLKTPLTAIITYIGLLKTPNLTEEKQIEYLATLEKKSLRLKALIEDLFEISKASSKSVKLELVEVDIFHLIKQAHLELSDKLSEANLEVRMMLPDDRIHLLLDSQKTFRIYENLFGNIAKYALASTRVYINAQVREESVSITMKNVSAQELTISTEELTERFVRGDVSRNTEGSGLGLAIAKSFAELQNGRLIIENDGDLFKVTTVWQRDIKAL